MITYNLKRWNVSQYGIIGDFYRQDELICFALEPPFRASEGAIPYGSYMLTWEKSPKLGIYTPRLNGVPGRVGILIHGGNTIADSEGCILLGSGWSMDAKRNITLQNSRPARDKAYELLEHDLTGGFAQLVVAREAGA